MACLLLGSSPQLLGSLLGLHDAALPALQAAAAVSSQQLSGGAAQLAQVSTSMLDVLLDGAKLNADAHAAAVNQRQQHAAAVP